MVKVFKEFLKHKEAWDLACSIDGTPANWWTQAIKHNKLKNYAKDSSLNIKKLLSILNKKSFNFNKIHL